MVCLFFICMIICFEFGRFAFLSIKKAIKFKDMKYNTFCACMVINMNTWNSTSLCTQMYVHFVRNVTALVIFDWKEVILDSVECMQDVCWCASRCGISTVHIHVNHTMHVLKFYCLFIGRKENLPNSNWEKSESSKFKANYQMKNK